MKTLLAFGAVASVAITLSGCVYYPDGPYGPGYGPYRSGYDRPQQESAGPPPQGDYGPQGYDGAPQSGPPPGAGPDDEQSYGPQNDQEEQDEMSDGESNKAGKAMAKINNPNWCAKHQKKCDKLRSKYGQPDQQMDSGSQPPPE